MALITHSNSAYKDQPASSSPTLPLPPPCIPHPPHSSPARLRSRSRFPLDPSTHAMQAHHNHSVEGPIPSAITHRACQACGTTVTSQWRYGHSGKVLLCNACGIRWKRKNQTAGRKRLKPGPKRVRHTTSLTTRVSSYALQPNLGTMLHNSSRNSVIHRNLSSSSSVTDYRPDASSRSAPWPTETKKSNSGYAGCSKMDIRLLCARQDSARRNFDDDTHGKAGERGYKSPISITSLLNVADEGGMGTECSSSSVSMTRRM